MVGALYEACLFKDEILKDKFYRSVYKRTEWT